MAMREGNERRGEIIEMGKQRVTSEGGAMSLHIGYEKGDPCLEQKLDWSGINGE